MILLISFFPYNKATVVSTLQYKQQSASKFVLLAIFNDIKKHFPYLCLFVIIFYNNLLQNLVISPPNIAYHTLYPMSSVLFFLFFLTWL
ncbi:unnamed protein product [Brugia timori]|uniref:Ovule protein n=1 Tax=Brugia timori TaxID=42155 RepID=A0A0R3QAV9_9BILA|nr:unnamed protein product [Brugia timori]